MADPFVLDTNVYIRAFRRSEGMAFVPHIIRRSGVWLRLAAPVATELRAGARSVRQRALLEEHLGALEEADRVHHPSWTAWREAGRVLAEVAERERWGSRPAPPSFVMDVLLAVTCREHDLRLVTWNGSDFARIQRELRGFRYIEPPAIAAGTR